LRWVFDQAKPRRVQNSTDMAIDPLVTTESCVISQTPTKITYKYLARGNTSARVQPGQLVREGELIAVRSTTPPVSVVDLTTFIGKNGKSVSFEVGDSITEGGTLAESSGRFGFGRRTVKAPTSGRVEACIAETGLLLIRPPSKEERIEASFPARVGSVGDGVISVELEGRFIRSAMAKGHPV